MVIARLLRAFGRWALLCLAVTFTTGCGRTVVWTHPTKNPDDFKRDASHCMQIAHQYASDIGRANNPLTVADEQQRCLQRKYGWAPRTVSTTDSGRQNPSAATECWVKARDGVALNAKCEGLYDKKE